MLATQPGLEWRCPGATGGQFRRLDSTTTRWTVNNMSATGRPGYHIAPIPRGELGELSKVAEELAEAFDAEAQGVDIMVLLELSDLVGAVAAYLSVHHPSVTVDDLVAMADVTARAFRNGAR